MQNKEYIYLQRQQRTYPPGMPAAQRTQVTPRTTPPDRVPNAPGTTTPPRTPAPPNATPMTPNGTQMPPNATPMTPNGTQMPPSGTPMTPRATTPNNEILTPLNRMPTPPNGMSAPQNRAPMAPNEMSAPQNRMTTPPNGMSAPPDRTPMNPPTQNSQNNATYPEVYYRIFPYIILACDQLAAQNIVPTQEMFDRISDNIYHDLLEMYPELEDYAGGNSMSENDAAVPTISFAVPRSNRRSRRRGILRDLIDILLLSEFYRRRRN